MRFLILLLSECQNHVERDTQPSHFCLAHHDQGCFLAPDGGWLRHRAAGRGSARVTDRRAAASAALGQGSPHKKVLTGVRRRERARFRNRERCG